MPFVIEDASESQQVQNPPHGGYFEIEDAPKSSTANVDLDSLIKNTLPNTPIPKDEHVTMPNTAGRWLEDNAPNVFTGLADTGVGISRMRNNFASPNGLIPLTDPDVLKEEEKMVNQLKSKQGFGGQLKSAAVQPGTWAAALVPEAKLGEATWPVVEPMVNAAIQGGTQGGLNSLLSADPHAAKPGEVDSAGKQTQQAAEGVGLGALGGELGLGAGYVGGKALSRVGDAANYGLSKITGLDVPDLIAGAASKVGPYVGNKINSATDLVNSSLPEGLQLSHVGIPGGSLPPSIENLQNAAKQLGLDVKEGDSNAVIRAKINEAMDRAASELGPTSLPTNQKDWGLDKNLEMSRQYGKNLAAGSKKFEAMAAEGLNPDGSAKMVDVSDIGNAAAQAVKDIEAKASTYGLTDAQRGTLGKLQSMGKTVGQNAPSTILDAAGNPVAVQAKGQMPINDFTDLVKSLHQNFNPSNDDWEVLKPIFDATKKVDEDVVPKTYPKFADLRDQARAYWKNNVLETFTDNPSIKSFWTPDDYKWAKSNGLLDSSMPWRERLEQNIMLNPQASKVPPNDTAVRAQNLLPNISDVGHLQTLQKALPEEHVNNAFQNKLAQLLNKTNNNGEYDINGLVKLLNPNQHTNPDYGNLLSMAGPQNQNKISAMNTVAQDLANRGYTGEQLPNMADKLATDVPGAVLSPFFGRLRLAKDIGKSVITGGGYSPLGQFANDISKTPFDATASNLLSKIGVPAESAILQKQVTQPAASPNQQKPTLTLPPKNNPQPAPSPSNNVAAPSADPLMQTVAPISQHFGNDPQLMHKIALTESNGNPNAQNPNSTALGLYQFTAPTWKSLVDRYGAQYGISYRDRVNPVANTIMANLLTNENRTTLEKSLGRSPSDGEIYLAHFAGAPTAVKILSQLNNRQVSAARLAPEAAKSNPSLFFEKGQPVTPAGLYQKLEIALNRGA